MRPQAFYEVTDRRGDAEFGTASALEAINWWRRRLDAKVYMSIWDEEDSENPKLITDKIDITAAITAAIVSEKDRG